VSNISMDTKRLPSLDGWRAISIVLVLGYHSTLVSGFPPSLKPAFDWIFDGNLGVRTFFIISGFLITWLMLAENDRTSRVNLRLFYLRRCLLILPIYCAYLCVLAALQYFTPFKQSTSTWIGNLTFTTNYFVGFDSGASNHLWSLAVEEQFYLIWPCLFILFGCARSLRACLLILGPAICISPIARVISYLHLEPHPVRILFSQFSFMMNFDSLAIGCACAVLLARKQDFVRLLTTTRPRLVFLIALAMIVVPSVLRENFLLGIFTVPLGNTFQSIGTGTMLLQSLISPRFGLYPVLNLTASCWLGVLSYSIYIWQQIFCVGPWEFGFANTWWLSFPFWLLPVFATALVSYRFLERPVFRLRAHFRA